MSLLRLGICRPEDWTGCAVDFVERGLKRTAQTNGITQARRVWQGDLRILDHTFELTERERQEALAEMDDPACRLFLVADFSAAASIPIAPALQLLESQDRRLPAAFFVAFRNCLRKWMYVYDHDAASEHAEILMADRDESELVESVYPMVKTSMPFCLRGRIGMQPAYALSILRHLASDVKDTTSRELISQLLEMERHSAGYPHYWPGWLARKIPGLDDYLEECDGIGPGCLLNWYEDDPISACFDEETNYIGQNGPLAPSILRAISLKKPQRVLDQQVRGVFGYIGAMIRSLASAAQIVEIIRELFDEHLRRHRLERGLQTDEGAPDLRQEQLRQHPIQTPIRNASRGLSR